MDFIANGALHYIAIIGTDVNAEIIDFKIMFDETKGGFFYSNMAAKELIRWIVNIEQGE